MRLPLKVQPGDPIKASEWNVMVDYLRSITPQSGAVSGGVRVARGISGITFTGKNVRGGRATATGPFPWQTSCSDAGVLSVHPGTINGMLPSNIFSDLTVADGLHFLKAKVTTNGKSVTSVTLAVEDSYMDCGMNAVENAAPATLAYIIAAISDGTVLQVVKTNIVITPTVAFLMARTPPTSWDEPFTRWWTWQ